MVAATILSGITVCSTALRDFTPSMTTTPSPLKTRRRRVRQGCCALSGDSRENDILCRAHARKAECDFRALETVGSRTLDCAAALADFHSEAFQSFQMEVYRSGTELAAARKGQNRLFSASEQRTQKDNRAAHFAHKAVGNLRAVYALAVHEHGRALALYLAAEIPKYPSRRADVRKTGTVEQNVLSLAQKRRRKHGQNTVFRALNRSASAELISSADYKSRHTSSPLENLTDLFYGRFACM